MQEQHLSMAAQAADGYAGASSLSHTPKASWEFDAEVTSCFEDMLARSIPQYDVMRQTVTDLASAFIENGSVVIDLGCSTGSALAPLVDRFGARARFYGLEVSNPMIEAARKRFGGMIAANVVDIRRHDLREPLPAGIPPARVILSVLTLMFTPIEYRPAILGGVYEALGRGGAFLMVEKVIGRTSVIDRLLTERYLHYKADSGYSSEAIATKRRSLEGVLVSVTAGMNEELLRGAGFGQVECVWRWLNFAAWIAVKTS